MPQPPSINSSTDREFLFRRLPPESGMAFVIVQHLSGDHVSMLSEIVQRATKMPVLEIQDGTKVLPNHVYVIPPDAIVEILHGVLHLRPLAQPHASGRLVDTFFRSLAFDHRNLAVGIVLSGKGTDGAQGLKDIKAEGGISLVQEPTSAKFDGMPRAAILVENPDLVLPVSGLVDELVKLAGRATKILEPALSSENEYYLRRVFLLIRSATGTDFSNYKTPTILRRIRRRMVLHKIESLKHYTSYLENSKEELASLFDDLLINVTEFFRDPAAFEILKTKVFPQILKDRPSGEAIRIWIPGCSTGEEVFSIAIALLEYLSSSPFEKWMAMAHLN